MRTYFADISRAQSSNATLTSHRYGTKSASSSITREAGANKAQRFDHGFASKETAIHLHTGFLLKDRDLRVWKRNDGLAVSTLELPKVSAGVDIIAVKSGF